MRIFAVVVLGKTNTAVEHIIFDLKLGHVSNGLIEGRVEPSCSVQQALNHFYLCNSMRK